GASYGGKLLDARDTWFCAPDLCQGPDGAVYVCDFHDRRTAHPDPDANWDRSNGRIYRVAPANTKPVRDLDLARVDCPGLVELLRHPNGWYAEQARVHLASRRDKQTWPALAALARQHDDPRLALQGVWGAYVSGGFDERLADDLLRHPSEDVRAWTVRLQGDGGEVSPAMARRLSDLAASDMSVRVRLQLAATSRRLPATDGLPIVEQLLSRGVDRDDPYLPLMIWWAVEARAMTNVDRLVGFFGTDAAWADPGRREHALRLVRRYAAEGTRAGYAACARLLATVPGELQPEALAAVDRGLAERSVAPGGMGLAGLFATVSIPGTDATVRARLFEPLTGELRAAIASAWRASPSDLARLRLAMRAGIPEATAAVSAEATNPATTSGRERELLGLLAELGGVEGVPVAFDLLVDAQPFEVQSAALDVLARHGDDSVSVRLLERYPKATQPLRAKLREVLLARPASARAFLERVESKEIDPAEVPIDQLKLVALHADPALDTLVRKHWGAVKAGTPEEKLAEMRRIANDLRAGPGEPGRGKALFGKHCATCHKLFGAGNEIGPDLTGVARDDTTALLAHVVDPSAVIRGPFLQYAVATRSGRVAVGLIAEQDNAAVTLVDAQGKRMAIPRDEIEELRELPNSIMPEDLLKPLDPQAVRDLFRYIQGDSRK
ncbi:MAG: c-type cytochrome, partial [Myxococcaceae bacterium]